MSGCHLAAPTVMRIINSKDSIFCKLHMQISCFPTSECLFCQGKHSIHPSLLNSLQFLIKCFRYKIIKIKVKNSNATSSKCPRFLFHFILNAQYFQNSNYSNGDLINVISLALSVSKASSADLIFCALSAASTSVQI